MNKHIKTLHLKNFQSHEDTRLDLVPGLNVLLGNSDTGKSAIVRAIRWLFYNEPAGDEFLQRGKSQVEVEAEFYDGSRLKRSRTKSINAYDLTLANQETMHFEGFGRNVPQEIVDYFHLKKFPISATDQLTLNIADQLEGPFLLQEKDSNKANAIGRLVGIHYVDLAQRNVNRDIVKINRDKKYQEDQLQALQESRQALSYIEDKKKLLDQFQEVLTKGKNLEEEKAILEESLLSAQAIKQEKILLKEDLSQLSTMDQAGESLNIVKNRLGDYRQRLEKKQAYSKLKEEISRNKEELNQVKDLNKTQKLYKDLVIKLTRLESLREVHEGLQKAQTSIKKEENLLKRLAPLEDFRRATVKRSLDIEKLKTYKDLYASFRDLESRKDKAKDYMGLFTHLDLGHKNLEDGLNKTSQLGGLKDLHKSYDHLKKSMAAIDKEKAYFSKELAIDQAQLKSYLEKLDVCPICKRPMDDHTIESIVQDQQ